MAVQCCDFYKIFIPWAPVIDGVELRQHPFAAVSLPPQDSDFDFSIPILHGANRDEGAFFDFANHELNQTALYGRWAAHYGEGMQHKLAALYLPVRHVDPTPTTWSAGLSLCPSRG
jgi:hypothetical protein